MSNVVLACRGLSKTFTEGKLNVPVLKHIDFAVEAKQSVAILGASGSGKSTLLHLLGGLDKPTTGTVFWQDKDIKQLNELQKCRLRNEQLGFIYQFHHLLPEFSALENVAMPLLIKGAQVKEAILSARQLLTKVGLANREQHKVGELSGGERQRTAIARALINRPNCILADEPTGNLDQKTAQQVMNVMMELQQEFATSFVIVTHDLTLAHKMQRCMKLENGILLTEDK